MKMTVTHQWKFVTTMVLALLYLAQLLRYIDLHGLNGLAWLGLVILVTAFVAAFRKIHVTWQIIESDAQVVIQKDKKVVFRGTANDLRDVQGDANDIYLYTRDRKHIQIPQEVMNEPLTNLVRSWKNDRKVVASDRSIQPQ